MMAYRDPARNNLTSEKGIRLRSERSIEVETVFGQIKHNTGFRRFMFRGIEKVNIEWGIDQYCPSYEKNGGLMNCHFLLLPTILFLVSFRDRFEVHSRQPPVAFFPI